MKPLTSAPSKFPFAENGARILRARKRTGLSQENFAPEVGTTRRHMIRLERGQHLPGGDLRDRIVERTGTTERILSADDAEEEGDLSMSLDDFLRHRIRTLVEEERGRQLDEFVSSSYAALTPAEQQVITEALQEIS